MRIQIEQRVGVQASPSQVWACIADLETWPQWNPMYPEVTGRLQIGGPLALSEVVRGDKPEQIKASIVDWVPDSQLVWTLRTAGGLIRRIRYLEIQQLTEGACIFTNGEVYQGLAVRLIPRKRLQVMRRAFAALGEALKAHVEAGLVQDAPAEPVREATP